MKNKWLLMGLVVLFASLGGCGGAVPPGDTDNTGDTGDDDGDDTAELLSLNLASQAANVVPNMSAVARGISSLLRQNINFLSITPTFQESNSTVEIYVAPFFDLYCHGGDDNVDFCADYGQTATSENTIAYSYPAVVNAMVYALAKLDPYLSNLDLAADCNVNTTTETGIDSAGAPTIAAGTIENGTDIILDDGDDTFQSLLNCTTDNGPAVGTAAYGVDGSMAVYLNPGTSNSGTVQAFASIDDEGNAKIVAINFTLARAAMDDGPRVQGARVVMIGNLLTHKVVGKVVQNEDQQPGINFIGTAGFDSSGAGVEGTVMLATMAEGSPDGQNGSSPKYYCLNNSEGTIDATGELCDDVTQLAWITDDTTTWDTLQSYLDLSEDEVLVLDGFGTELVRWSESVSFYGTTEMNDEPGDECAAPEDGDTYGLCTNATGNRHFMLREEGIRQDLDDTFFVFE